MPLLTVVVTLRCEFDELPIYPLRFDPILQYRPWGGHHLQNWVTGSLPANEPIGEAWLLSDRADNPSCVAEGPLTGWILSEIMERSPRMILGDGANHFKRFPLLLKYLDAAGMLSVQVHPSDNDRSLISVGESGKTEAWVVLETIPGSRIYAGLNPGATKSQLRHLSVKALDSLIPSFAPSPGQCIQVDAGTVHSLGKGIVVLEVQQNNDVTFRLFDWGHIDAKTSLPRPLQVECALQCVDFNQSAVQPTTPVTEQLVPNLKEGLLDNCYFQLTRLHGATPYETGNHAGPTILVCIAGTGNIEYAGKRYALQKGGLILLPAAAGECRFIPDGVTTMLEISLPSKAHG